MPYFSPMRLCIFIFTFIIVGCITSEHLEVREKELVQIEIVFSSDESIKLVPYELSALKLSLTGSLQGVDRGYSATILVVPNQVDSILEKVGLDEGVSRISRVEL